MGKKEKKNLTLSVGFYPGILMGLRTYEEKKHNCYVLYLPFVDIAVEIYK